MEIKPIGNRVLVQLTTEEKKEEKFGQIYIPPTNERKEKPSEGIIIEIGTGSVALDGKDIPMKVNKGQKILFNEYSGIEIQGGSNNYLLIKESDILAVIG